MIIHQIKGSNGESRIVLGERLANVGNYIGARRAVIITDENVQRLYHDQFPHDLPVIAIGTGEGNKTLRTVEQLYQYFLDTQLDRSAVVVAVGGGIVCDLAGFAASTYLRGITFGFVPTTLLAQVDASVGGKNGVNFAGYKNQIGTFNQPEFVLADFDLLKTLPPREFGNGLAEAIKHGAIADFKLFTFMEDQVEAIRNWQPESLERIVNDSIVIKAAVVNRDEKEQGERRKLNFGHTFGHAVERTLGLPHGEAVAIGMVVAAKLSEQHGYLTTAEIERLQRLLQRYDLPVSFQADQHRLIEAMWKDKKRYGDGIKFVLLEKLGAAIVEEVTLQQLEMTIRNIL